VPAGLAVQFIALLVLASVSLPGGPAEAHGFGQRYDLPIPLSFYIFGAGATVALSFVVAAVFLRTTHIPQALAQVPLLRTARSRRWASGIALMVRVVAAAYFVVMIAAGLFGAQTPFRNIIVASVWIVGWVAISLLSALIGDVWRLLNPWDTLFAAAERVYTRLRPGRLLTFGLGYPAGLDVWPALVLFVGFAWMELVWAGRDVPARLAEAVLFYSGLTWLGMLSFGRARWREHAEVFSIVFGIFARFAPVACTERRGLTLRVPAVGLLKNHGTSSALTLLVITLLATVTFDGFLETPLWARVDIAIIDTPDDSILWTALNLSEAGALRLARSVGLILFIALFGAVYLSACNAMVAVTGSKLGGTFVLARRFVFSLLPISIAYHIAHYFSYLFNGGQIIIPLLSDPFGFGWDLFGTAAYQPDIGLVEPLLQWYVAITAIVVGHVIAVWVAHLIAMTEFGDRSIALRSQAPFLLLMVCYTMVSLWILSQPIVETGPGS
jgi:hypothetical protein